MLSPRDLPLPQEGWRKWPAATTPQGPLQFNEASNHYPAFLQPCDVGFSGMCCFIVSYIMYCGISADLDSSPNSQINLLCDPCQVISFYIFKWQSYLLGLSRFHTLFRSVHLCFNLLAIEGLRAILFCVSFLSWDSKFICSHCYPWT